MDDMVKIIKTPNNVLPRAGAVKLPGLGCSGFFSADGWSQCALDCRKPQSVALSFRNLFSSGWHFELSFCGVPSTVSVCFFLLSDCWCEVTIKLENVCAMLTVASTERRVCG